MISSYLPKSCVVDPARFPEVSCGWSCEIPKFSHNLSMWSPGQHWGQSGSILLLMGSSLAEPWGSLSGQGGQAGAQSELLPSQGSPDSGIFGVVAVERPSHRGQARGELPRQPQWMRVLGGAPGTGGSEHTEAGVMGVEYPSFPGSAGLVPWFWRAEGT